MVDTGDEWGPNAVKTIAPLKPACAVLRFGDLASRPFDWPDLVHGEPEALTYRRELFSLRPHQKTALDDVTGGFKARDRGKLVMACGTGKTFAALRIAEAVAGVGGRVLYLVPSISLFQQSMREWATRSYDGPIDLIVDSTGLKIPGCGEWNAHKHKASKKRRDWRKLHIGVDAEGFIVAAELTASSRDDASTLPALLDTIEVPIRRFTADGAYDHRSVYDRASAAGTENVVIVIPPRRSALSAGPTDGPWAQRDTALERIRQVGRREWRKESGYRQQARVENSFFRYKSVLGGGLKARPRQGTKERSCDRVSHPQPDGRAG